MDIQVECYAGYRGEETPLKMTLGSNQILVKTMIDRWLAPDHRYFKFLGDDNSIYIIRHSIETWKWELTLYKKHDSRGFNYDQFGAA